MKITFVVPALNLTGGLRVVSVYANLLTKKGHKVTVVSPNKRIQSIKEKIKAVLNWKGSTFQSGFNLAFFENVNFDVKILEHSSLVTCDDVPDADVIIATFWNTAEWVADFPNSKGKKVYFIQHHEVHPWLPIERVKATFTLPFKKIVVAQWIAKIMQQEYKQENVTIVANAVDDKLFYASARQKGIPAKFGMMYSERSYKGSQLAFDCFNQLREEYPSVQLVAFGLESPEKVIGLPENAIYYAQPDQNIIRDIYSQCDAWLFTSNTEGFGLPILEAMACRTPVIGTRCGAAPDLLESGGGILINVNNKTELFSAMARIYNMGSDEWLAMSDMAYKEAQSHHWADKAMQFERAIST